MQVLQDRHALTEKEPAPALEHGLAQQHLSRIPRDLRGRLAPVQHAGIHVKAVPFPHPLQRQEHRRLLHAQGLRYLGRALPLERAPPDFVSI